MKLYLWICGLCMILNFGYSQNCTVTIDLPQDTILCGPGSLMLPAQINGAFTTFSWSPAIGLNDTTLLQPTATLSQDIAYTLRVQSISTNNLIFNGDFQQGNTGFTSDYTLGNSTHSTGILTEEGQYAITDDPSDPHSQFNDCNDHTGGGGQMMVVNASGQTNNVWCQQIMVNADTDYDFSAWVTSVTSQNPARLQFSINGELLGDEFVASANTCNWQNFSATWASGNETSAEICIVNVNLTPAGNDFALDDIVFREICTTSATIFIDIANLNASFSLPTAICQAEEILDLNDFLDFDSDLGGEWRIDNQALGGGLLDLSTLSSGSHFVQYEVSAGDCNATASGGFNIDEFFYAGEVPVTPLPFCPDASLIDLDDYLTNAVFGADWLQLDGPSVGNAFDPAPASLDLSALAPDTYRFAYISAANGVCPGDSAILDIVLNPAPVADAGPDQSLDCFAGETQIGNENADLSLNYSWTLQGNPLAGLTQPVLTVTEVGTYVLAVTDSGDCIAYDTVQVTQGMVNISASLTISDADCEQNTGQISVNDVSGGIPPYVYSLNGASFQSSPDFTNVLVGNHTILVQDAAGCEIQLIGSVNPASDISVLILTQGSTAIRAGDSLQLDLQITGDTATSIQWSANTPCAGCTSVTVRPAQTSVYSVTVTNARGCSATAEIIVQVEEVGVVYMPNVFSPNEDGVNDVLYVQSSALVEEVMVFQVFDRWGGLVFSQDSHAPNDATFGWKGRKDGQPSPPGVYVFKLELRLIDGNSRVFAGEVNLLR